MAFGVFMHRSDSIYDDSPAEHYQFPANYLSRAQAFVGDWIVYLEPTRVRDSRGYFALARVQRIIDDPKERGMFRALIEPGTYMDFAKPVPFRSADGIVEAGLFNTEGRLSGRAQSAVRPLSPFDLDRILTLSLSRDTWALPRIGAGDVAQGFHETQAPFGDPSARERIAFLGTRVVRERVFRDSVLRAYGKRCAITGLMLINGGGRAEVEAAHIRPVEADGPDSVSNGLALSGTVHWMFDRGMISIDDDRRILLSRHLNDPTAVRGLINKDGFARAPSRIAEHPHPTFLAWHREHCFKA